MNYIPETRPIALLKNLAKNKGNITKSALESGYSEYYAKKCQKRIMKTAQNKSKQLIDIESKKLVNASDKDKPIIIDRLNELIGISRQEYSNHIKTIVEQNKDISTKFKVLQSLSKYTDIDLSTESETKQIIPTLNIAIKEINNIQKPQEIKQIAQENEL